MKSAEGEKSQSGWDFYLLTSLPGYGPRSLRYLLQQAAVHSLSVQDIFRLDDKQFASSFPELGKGRFSQARHAAFAAADLPALEVEYNLILEKGIHLLVHGEPSYPSRVADRMGDDAPLLLYCKGDPASLSAPSFAVVGSRNVTDEVGRKARTLAGRIARSGFVIVSGNARGVDQPAHAGTLDAGGHTVMVLPEGILRFAPTPEQRDFPNLHTDVTVVSPYRPAERFSGQNAMRRNLLICALSDVVVVVAAGLHDEARSKGSGSLDTGEQALRLGLPLFVVSPALLRPEPEGNALLIREGGREVTSAKDILEHLELRIPAERFPSAYAAEVEQRHAEIRASAKKKKAAPPEQPTLF